MNDLIVVDYLTLSFFAMSFVLGLMRGVIKETLSLLNWIVSIILARNILLVLSYVGISFLPDNSIILIVSKIFMFLVSLFIGSLLIKMIQNIIKNLGLGGLDRFLGGIFGAIRGVVIIGILYYATQLLSLEFGGWWTDGIIFNFYEGLPIFNEPSQIGDVAQDISNQVLEAEL